MTTIDISTLNLPELKALQADVVKAIATREAETVNAARAQIAEIAKGAGIDLKTLIGKVPAAGNKALVKYIDPANSQNKWTGRGRAPVWAAALKEAGTLETARV